MMMVVDDGITDDDADYDDDDVFVEDDDGFVSPFLDLKKANEAAEILGLTPIKIETKESKSKRAIKIERKSEQMRSKVKEVLQETLLSESTMPSSSTSKYIEGDFVHLLENIK